jgi:hypothetical protein
LETKNQQEVNESTASLKNYAISRSITICKTLTTRKNMIPIKTVNDYGERPVIVKDQSFDELSQSLEVDSEILSNLSWGALGLLVFLRSNPEATKEEILQASTNTEEEVDSLLLELIGAGVKL